MRSLSVVIGETYWGYIVRPTEPASARVAALQLLALGTGVVLLLLAAGLWLVPSGPGDGPLAGLRIGASAMAAVSGTLCLWFASRGVGREIHVDTCLGEIRGVIRNRAGRPTLAGRYGFDSIGRVTVESRVQGADLCRGHDELILFYRNTEQKMPVARGVPARLGALRDRIGRDMMLSPQADTARGGLIWGR